MMERKKLYKISVFLSVIGLTLMYASSLYLTNKHVEIGEIEKSWSGKNVKVTGKITSYTESGGHAFMDVSDSSGNITVVNFDAQESFEQGDRVNVTGHVEIYKGELEIIVKEIKD